MATVRQRYSQLMEWLEIRKQKNSTSNTAPSRQKFSKANTYNKGRR